MTRLLTQLSLVMGLLLSPVASIAVSDSPCGTCHPAEVKGYARSAMASALRRAGKEPVGSFVHEFSETKFTVYTNREGTWQRRERGGDVSEYRVEYVIGSGQHASGYLVRVGRHFFQSPIGYYPRIKGYDMAPGYERARAPDFIRPVTVECLTCHSGKPRHIEGTISEYEDPAFAEEAISCARCHGDPTEHLKMPSPGSIVNPAKLAPAARFSVCEQCHLMGTARVLNPGKKFIDFQPGMSLEDVFTIYVPTAPPGRAEKTIKVISHSEQLALSTCARQSDGRMWCGTCHDPHDMANKPTAYYRERCLSCHEPTLASVHPKESLNGDCVSCHMAERDAKDGGHTVFTDHLISRHPEPQPEDEMARNVDLVAWREPPPAFRERNLALAYVHSGTEHGSPTQIVRGLHMLTEVEKQFPDDPDVLTALGMAFLSVRQPKDAVPRLERVLELGRRSAENETNVGTAWLKAGRADKATEHLERAVQLDPLLLPAVQALMQVYEYQGEKEKGAALADRVRQALGSAAPKASGPAGQ